MNRDSVELICKPAFGARAPDALQTFTQGLRDSFSLGLSSESCQCSRALNVIASPRVDNRLHSNASAALDR